MHHVTYNISTIIMYILTPSYTERPSKTKPLLAAWYHGTLEASALLTDIFFLFFNCHRESHHPLWTGLGHPWAGRETSSFLVGAKRPGEGSFSFRTEFFVVTWARFFAGEAGAVFLPGLGHQKTPYTSSRILLMDKNRAITTRDV